MIKKRAGLTALAVLGATALALTACSSNSSNGGGSGSANASGIVTTNGTEPQKPLIPSNTTETGGGKVIDSLFEGLVSYDADGKPVNEVAKSIDTDDSKTFDIKLNTGYTFTNGEKVTAESFTKAWNWAAQFSNKQSASYFFENIEGYNAEKDSELTGLKVVSDDEFTVKLKSAQSDFPLSLGYSAFVPLPSSFYDDTKAFGENPIGNGPYKFDGKKAWTHNQSIKLVANKDYEGKRKPKNGGLTITFYTSQDTAYADAQGGNLDVLDAVPDANFQTYKSDFPDSNVNQPAAIFQGIYLPYYLDHWKGEEGKLRREAVSMAINRKEITDKIFDGTRTPAKDFTSPVIAGWNDDLEGSEVLDYNKSEAKKLWAEADKISKYNDTLTITYNADGGHQAWVTAVTNSISSTLGIKAEGNAIPTFQEALDLQTNDKLTGGSRTGWQADYPSLYNFLGPTMGKGSSSNYARYDSAEYNELLAKGRSAATVEEGNKIFDQAQELLFKDLPEIPLWYSNVTGVWNADTVSNVKFGWNSVPLYYDVEVKN
ncbi:MULTISPECIES: peptide ABC transporter substrate-binding protein [Curtobacterium]|uniref:ABC transporter substrate-binding protein n=1 Tax=Curtobacterium flaccumfaciens pv. flaccumfaciens TaxID=138532 RepID=A0A9Q2ZL81_9MICO|nr:MULTISPECIES: ABC transporter substrate-binding protein [Curtobacterium]KQR26766.1 ABC transporter substrate-binding protein [Curtobacterium sp. Leaf154]MBF4595988.1 ABC transporter substrate-binding protein [Curtobacterium sp. VKM Ac-1796]MBF4611104.1 ABC transporter substrate-binding protein [Curtobacterium sp. VKM Ac-2889]MBT1542586.1 ABC transporter substrate-binding protein [Curtobacterium flaccumfaciens pv. flaccumfaciens]OII03146.1 ABC transporter substrate-binding protein [Curtobact